MGRSATEVWLTLLLSTASCTFATQDQPETLKARQLSGAVPSNEFLRRAYHASGVLNGWVYIDGGDISYMSGGEAQLDYSTSLLAIDLSADFTPSTVTIQSSSKPDGVPNLNAGDMWVDETSGTLYTGMSGQASYFNNQSTPDEGLWSYQLDGGSTGEGLSGTWKSENSSASSYFVDTPRPAWGLSASGNNSAFFVGGVRAVHGSSLFVDPGMIVMNFSDTTVQNKTIPGSSQNRPTRNGRMVYSPNFGTAGVVISVGGFVGDNGTYANSLLASMNTIQVLDVASNTWYQVHTTGEAPLARREYCMTGAASTESTFEIFLYAGWADALGTEAVKFDTAYVLSLPSFQWFQADYISSRPRHGLTCEHIGGGQILTIGGVDTTATGNSSVSPYNAPFETPDSFPQGLAVFDLSTMTFTNQYNASMIQYDQNSALSTTLNSSGQPIIAKFQDSKLETVFTTTNFPKPGQSSSSNSSHSNTGAIAGGVVGGVVGLAMIGGLAYWLLRRRKRHSYKQPSELESSPGPSKHHVPVHGSSGVHELQDRVVHELPAENPHQELPVHTPLAEMGQEDSMRRF